MIHIIDNYYAISNNYGYTVARMTGKIGKTGKPCYITIDYCGNLKEVLKLVINDAVHERMRESTVELNDALEYIKFETDRIMKALEGIEV